MPPLSTVHGGVVVRGRRIRCWERVRVHLSKGGWGVLEAWVVYVGRGWLETCVASERVGNGPFQRWETIPDVRGVLSSPRGAKKTKKKVVN